MFDLRFTHEGWENIQIADVVVDHLTISSVTK